MKPEHPTDEILDRFARGELVGSVVVDVALHLDDCPACAAHAIDADPLAFAFASADDPRVPEGLVRSILEVDRRPRQAPPEPAIAAGLLAGAALVMVVAGNPAGFLVRGAAALRAMLTATDTLLAHMQGFVPGGQAAEVSTLASALLAGMLLVFSVATARRLEARRSA